MNLSRKTIRISIALLALTLVGGVSFYLFVLHGQFSEIASIESKIAKADGQLLDSKKRETNGADRQADKLAGLKGELREYVVGQKESQDFALYIQQVAELAGVKDFSGTHRMKESYGPIDECVYIVEGRMQVDFKATFSQFAFFVNSLERNRPVVFVDNFSISNSRNTGSDHKVSMSLSFLVGQSGISDLTEQDAVKTAGL